jgi:hypothetical protein
MRAAKTALPEPYAVALEKYLKLAARSPAVLSVELCGTLANPGLSDIDILLVVRDFEELQANPILFVRLLNPEGLSHLFTHGPVVCRPHEYTDLLSFTTLKPSPLWRSDDFSPPTSAAGAGPGGFGTLTLQATCITHYAGALRKARAARHRLLLAGGVMHSLSALAPFAGSEYRAVAARRTARITSLRGAWCRHPEPAPAAMAQAEALSACDDLISCLAGLLRQRLQSGELRWIESHPAPERDLDLVVAFRDAFLTHGLGTGPGPAAPPITVRADFRDDVGRRFSFIASLLEVQLRYRLVASGAEFPFTLPGLTNRIGVGIWLRRLLKRIARLRLHFP